MMSLRPDRLWLLWPLLGLFFASESFALGLGDIELHSALNEPLRAEIHLVSASPEALADLKVALASADTFDRYDLYRPLFLTRLTFDVKSSGQAGGSVIEVRSDEPITEPFVTFLVEATWPAGHLLREYTVLLDPPTFAPRSESPPTAALTAPRRAAPAERGRIERQAAPASAAGPENAAAPFDAAAGNDVRVERGDTLWGIAERVRPDERLSMNQTMLAIYEANPQAFGGNINRLTAGSTLTIPGAEAIFAIDRHNALGEVARQNAAFGLPGGSGEPRLTLVPPDGEQEPYTGGTSAGSGETAGQTADGAAADERVRELEKTVADQKSLIEVRDNELAELRSQLAAARQQAAAASGTAAPGTLAETAPATGEAPAAEKTDRVFADDSGAPGTEEEPSAAKNAAANEAAPAAAPAPRATPARQEEPGLIDKVVGALTGFWGILVIVLILVLLALVWFAKRAAGRNDDESTGVWGALDDDDVDSESRASTERLRALARDDDSAIVVVEQETSPDQKGRTRERAAADGGSVDLEATVETGVPANLEDTFSGETGSETAINLDQSDPLAEADFHMAYGLYDQAADLINGALAVEPERQDLMAKLCEIYFVWGNRDAFVDAASRLHDQLGGEATPDWDKIVIMGQQIAGEHKLFSGVSVGAATRAIDLSLDSDDEAGALDMELSGGPDGQVSDVVDLGADDRFSDGQSSDGRSDGDDALDFLFDEVDTGASTTREMPGRDEATVESPTIESEIESEIEAEIEAQAADTIESPTIESPVETSMDRLDSTSELPSLADSDDFAGSGDETAEIDLDDLGLDLHDLAESGLGAFDDDEDNRAGGDFSDRDATVESDAFGSADDPDATGRNIGIEEGIGEGIDEDTQASATGIHEGFDLDALDATGKNPLTGDPDRHAETDADVDFDVSLLDATGHTQVLADDFAVDTDFDAGSSLGDEDKTLLAPLFDENAETLLAPADGDHEATAALSREEVDFDFARTEALPKDAFSRDPSTDETGEMPSQGVTDLDLDLDDLTEALRLSEGDTVDQPRDDATVERQRPRLSDGGLIDLDVGGLDDPSDDVPTQALSSDEFSDDLHDARTMTEVGTKLDLARAYVDMGDPEGARSILDEVIDEGDEGQRQQAQKLIDSLPT